MTNHEQQRNASQQAQQQYSTESAYQSLRDRMHDIQREELSLDKRALKRTGITDPVHYHKAPRSQDLEQAMQVLWDVGTIDGEGRADAELRRPYHLIAKGRAPLTEADVIKVGQMRDQQLLQILPWLSHRTSLNEAEAYVDLGGIAPPVIENE